MIRRVRMHRCRWDRTEAGRDDAWMPRRRWTRLQARQLAERFERMRRRALERDAVNTDVRWALDMVGADTLIAALDEYA